MFTGIITNVEDVKSSKQQNGGLTITFSRPGGWPDLALGESIATEGVCLTVAALRDSEYDCHLIPETLAKTSFGTKVPRQVNLERSLQLNDRFGGHFVQGHVDGVGVISKIDQTDGYRLKVEFPAEYSELVIYKGSICLNGVSLTVAETAGGSFIVALIPHTVEHTTLGSLRTGDSVNLEFDMLGKYIVNYLKTRSQHADSN